MKKRNLLDRMRVADEILTGTLGKWEVEKRTITQAEEVGQLGTLYATGRSTPAGAYAGLFRLGEPKFLGKALADLRPRTLVMSDTPDEMRDLIEPIYQASLPETRTALVHGLGIGCFVKGLVSFDHIESIDVVEIDEELIELMPTLAPWLRDPRVTIRRGDAYTYEWPVGTRWDVVWHDVWDTLDTDNLSEGYARLNRRFGSRAGWQGAWGQAYLQRMRECVRFSW